MCERLRSLGLDVGTTTTQLVFSELQVENQGGAFSVPRMEITDRKLLYKSPVHFTPQAGTDRIDGAALGALVRREYERAGIRREDVDTGAVIVTGETSRRENARDIAAQLSDLAGDFVVATAGPELESRLAARGAGAEDYSRELDIPVLHMDIGGGTSNLALLQGGRITALGCLNVGGRLVKTEGDRITYVSPTARPLTSLREGDPADISQLEELAKTLVMGLEMAAGLRPADDLLAHLQTREAIPWIPPRGKLALSFSGGVADCIEDPPAPLAYGDMGPLLGKAIRQSRLCQGPYRLGRETIRATVIGAGCYSTQLSGSTVYCQGAMLPVKNLPVAVLDERQQMDPEQIARCCQQQDGNQVILALPGFPAPTYEQVQKLARAIIQGVGDRPVYVCLEQDMAKALGHSLRLQLPENRPLLCIDRVCPQGESYLDIGMPVGHCLPVVLKTLVFS